MQVISPVLLIEMNNFEFTLVIGENSEDGDFKYLYDLKIPAEGMNDNSITDFNLIHGIIKKNLLLLEQKFKCILKEVTLIIGNFNCSLVNVSGYKKLNGSQLAKENITYILNSLKQKVSSIERDKSILHIFSNNYFLDKKRVENLPIGLFGNLYSHELSFYLIDSNYYKNLQNLFNKCNLRVKRVISKEFLEGVSIINKSNIDTFFKIDINENFSKIIYYENSSLKFMQNFKFGSNLIINDICKVIAIKPEKIREILVDNDFLQQNFEKIIENKFFTNQNFRKIKKQLLFDIANARIQEIFEIILFKNINISNLKQKIFLNLHDEILLNFFKDFNNNHVNNTSTELKFINELSFENIFTEANSIVQYGWKKEAIPFIQEKKSIIARLFNLFFK